MIISTRRWLGGFVVALTLFPAGVRAQSLARSFEEIQRVVKAGDIIFVIDRGGQETRGTLAEVSGSSLVLLVSEFIDGLHRYRGKKRIFDEDAVAEIRASNATAGRGRRIYFAPARSFQELQHTLKAGQQVVVTDDSGGRMVGKVGELSASDLVVHGAETRTFAQGRVTEIQRAADPTRNGTLIGLGVGALGALSSITILYAGCGSGCEAPAFFPVAGTAAALGAGAGALVGYLLDKARKGQGEVVFSGPTPARVSRAVTVSPVVRSDRRGVLVSVHF